MPSEVRSTWDPCERAEKPAQPAQADGNERSALGALLARNPPLAISHRGHHVSCPENTLEAFAQAVELGADGIETDVRLSRDGLPVLFHDRIAPDGREVAALTAAELTTAAGYPVPTLAQALDGFPAPLWNVEVKVAAAVAATARVLAAFRATHRLLVTSFWHPAVLPFADLAIDTGLLLASRPFDLAPLLPRRAPQVTALVWFYEALDPVLLAQAAERGMYSLAYGPTTPAEHESCLALAASPLGGLAGIITDHLHLLPPGASG